MSTIVKIVGILLILGLLISAINYVLHIAKGKIK